MRSSRLVTRFQGELSLDEAISAASSRASTPVSVSNESSKVSASAPLEMNRSKSLMSHA